MLGAIIGDVVGSRFEFKNNKTKDFELITDESTYTDDTVLTMACLDWCLNDFKEKPASVLKRYVSNFPHRGYGISFLAWAKSDDDNPYNSFGNGSAMRTSPIAYFDCCISHKALYFALATHNHEEGIKGAQCVSILIDMCLNGSKKEDIRREAIKYYPIIENMEYEDLVKNYKFDGSCQGTVPQAIYCFLISKDFEDCLRTTISIGGDSDTLAAISCSIAEAYYKSIPKDLEDKVLAKLPKEFLDLLEQTKRTDKIPFYKKF